MEQDFCAFNVAKKFNPQTLAGRSALNKSRDIGKNKFIIYPEVRLKRRKRIIRDLAFCFRELIKKA